MTGKKKIEVKICCGMNCLNRGGQELLDLLEDDAKIQANCAINANECLERCEDGAQSPVVSINGTCFTRVAAEKLIDDLYKLIDT